MNRIKTWLFVSLLFCVSAFASSYIWIKRAPYDLVVQDQPVGTSIFVDRLILTHGGYLIITPQSDDAERGTPSISDYMPAGIYTDFNVDIYWGDELNVPAGTKVTVKILRDNGDVNYDPRLDEPARDTHGHEYEKSIYLR